MRVFEGFPDRPHPLAHAIVGTACGAATPMVGPWLMEDRPTVLPLVGLGAAGGLAIGTTMGALEAVLPSRSFITGLMRCSMNLALASAGGAAAGAVLAAHVGLEVPPAEDTLGAGVLGLAGLVMGTTVAGLAAVLLGLVPADDF